MRIVDSASAIIAADNQLNDVQGYQIFDELMVKRKIQKLIKSETSIFGCSGFVGDKEINILAEINGIDNSTEIIDKLNAVIPQKFSLELIILLFSEIVGNTLNHGAIYGNKDNFEIMDKSKIDLIFSQRIARDIFGSIDIKWNESFEANLYSEHVDFNFNYAFSKSDLVNSDIDPVPFYTLFHIKLFQRFGERSLSAFLDSDDNEKVEIIEEFYNFINNLKLVPGDFVDENIQFRTVGECTDILKIDKTQTKWLLKK